MDLSSIVKAQEIIKKDIELAIGKNDYSRVLRLCDTFADFTQRINNILRDDIVESAVEKVSSLYKRVNCCGGDSSDVVVFYDLVGTTKCLELQYLRGLVACGYKVYYIYVGNRPVSTHLLKEVQRICENNYIFDKCDSHRNLKDDGQQIIDIIESISPSIVLVHPAAAGSFGISLLYAIQGIKKYRIVPGDHHYYVGYNCFDYFIEFRTFGEAAAIQERGIAPNKIRHLPYYPIKSTFVPFAGFPNETKGKVIVLSAGAEYKFVGSDIYIELSKYILSNNNTVIVYLGKPSKKIIRFSESKEADGRFYLLGFRADFVQCVEHCDFVLNSYPMSGGLVCQTAGGFNKPVVHYCEEKEYLSQNVEDIFGSHSQNEHITFTSLDETKRYIDMLITDKDYLISEGARQHSLLQSETRFNYELGQILSGKSGDLEEANLPISDRSRMIELYVAIQNSWRQTMLIPLFLLYRISFIWKFPCFYRDCLLHPWFSLKYLVLSYLLLLKSSKYKA